MLFLHSEIKQITMLKSVFLSTLFISVTAISSLYAQSQSPYNSSIRAKAQEYANEVYKNCTQYTQSTFIQEYATNLSQVEIKTKVKTKDETLPLLSSVELKNKCNTMLKRDDALNFDPTNFNALKYFFNFYSKTAQTYRVDGTNYIVIIQPRVSEPQTNNANNH